MLLDARVQKSHRQLLYLSHTPMPHLPAGIGKADAKQPHGNSHALKMSLSTTQLRHWITLSSCGAGHCNAFTARGRRPSFDSVTLGLESSAGRESVVKGW